VNYVGYDKQKFKMLLLLFLKGDYRLTQRAAWPLSYIVIEQPQLVKPYFKQLISKLKDEKAHPSVARNILRMFEYIDIPENYQAEILDLCFKFIPGEVYSVAIRAFAITTAGKICKPYPELKKELLFLLNELAALPQKPAIKVRIKKALKELK
jgi:hypothetical protein